MSFVELYVPKCFNSECICTCLCLCFFFSLSLSLFFSFSFFLYVELPLFYVEHPFFVCGTYGFDLKIVVCDLINSDIQTVLDIGKIGFAM